jgi:hypothetical protein
MQPPSPPKEREFKGEGGARHEYSSFSMDGCKMAILLKKYLKS